jgi:hypothetical protein
LTEPRLQRSVGPPTRPDLERALHHVNYEIWMCAASVARLRASEQTDRVARNAFLEVHLLHARNVIEFLTRSGQRSSIRRVDFRAEWKPAPSDSVDRLNDHYVVMHTRLAHLTWDRVRREEVDWPSVRLAMDVLAVARSWGESLAVLDPEFSEMVIRAVANGDAEIAHLDPP